MLTPLNITIIAGVLNIEFCAMPRIRILATEDDALHEEMLRITIDKLGYELIDVVYRPSDLFLKLNATKPDEIKVTNIWVYRF